jgi:hypothetical protein
VTEHMIRLRGGWACRALDSPDSSERPLTLPVRWGPHDPARMFLTRKFGRPRLDPDRETLLLKMDHVPGILSVDLNGHPIARSAALVSRYEIELAHLLDRNVLVLEIETPESRLGPAGNVAEWGMISLVIRPVEPADRP